MVKRLPRIVLLLTMSATLLASAAGSASSADPLSKVSPSVLRATADGGTASFLAILTSRADLSGAAALSGKLAKGRFVFDTLRAHAVRTQAPIVALLDRMGATYRSHWLVNLLRVTGGRDVAMALAARADIERIVPDARSKSTILPDQPARISAEAPGTVEWNVSRVRAPRAWAQGFTGQGIVLGSIDTGQQWDHPALKSHYRGWNGVTADHNYNWYDATTPPSNVPIDPYGHGTHTAGTMVGDDGGTNQVGVAPGAKWMACRSMDEDGFGSPDTYITCFEFMMAPWDLGRKNPDPSKAPVAVSNSWYCSISLEQCTQGVLFEAVQNVRAAGIVPVVAAGNARMARKLAVPLPPLALRTLGETLLSGSADDADPAADASSVADIVSRRTIRGRRFTAAGSFLVGAARAAGLGWEGASYRGIELFVELEVDQGFCMVLDNRAASPESMALAIFGSSWISRAKSARPMASRTAAALARTRAVWVPSGVSSANSPRNSPGPSSMVDLPGRSTTTVPSRTTRRPDPG